MNDLLATIAVILGVGFAVLSAIGILRMPDVYIRLQVASKASSLGIALLMIGVAIHFGELSVMIRAMLVVLFLFLTAPVAAHLIGRAAYLTGVPLVAGTDPDELAGGYETGTGRLLSPAQRRLLGADRPVPVEAAQDPDAADVVADMLGEANTTADEDSEPTDASDGDADQA